MLDLVEHGLEIDAVRGDLHGNFLDGARMLESRRQGVGLENVPAAEYECWLDHVLQLPDIAGPPVVVENRERLRADPFHRISDLRGDFPDEVRGKQRNILWAL